MRLACSLGLAALLALSPLPALAQGSAAAEALFQQGRALLAEGKVAEACQRFAQSQELEAKLGTLLNLAACHEQEGRTATAWAEFTTAATLAQREGQAEREAFARERIAALSGKLSTLTIEAPNPPEGLAVTLDGAPYPITGAPLPIDPGDHAVEARAPGRRTYSARVTVAGERQSAKVTIPPLEVEAAPPAAPPPPAAAPPPAAPPAREPEEDGSGGVHPVAIAGFVIGGAGLLVGSVTGGVTMALGSSLTDACGDDDVCPADREGDLDTANALANVSNVSFVLGAVGVGVGLTALLVSGGGDDDDGRRRRRAHVEPTIGLGQVGARGRF